MGLILASGSPRRSLLLSAAGIAFTTMAPDVDESPIDMEAPTEYVLRLSSLKAHAVARRGDDVVLGADTTVVLDGTTIGKPHDPGEALTMLLTLSGRTHSVLTGWTVIGPESDRFGVEESLVTFRSRSEEDLRDYVARTEPLDKAGAYALQGDDGWLIEKVQGSRANVMGLPIREVIEALQEFGIQRSTA